MTEAKTAQDPTKSEMMVLGCMLTSINSYDFAINALNASDFNLEGHKTIFSVLEWAHSEGKNADVHIVAEELKRRDKLKSVGGVAYLTTLAQYSGTSAHIEEYVKLVLDSSISRELNSIAYDLSKKSFTKDVGSLLGEFSTKLDLLKRSRNKVHVESLYLHLLDPTSEEEIVAEIKDTSPGLRVGLKIGQIDLELPGGAITITAAPTSHGKTTLLINLSLGLLKQNPTKSVYFFSFEENRSSILSLFLNSFMKKDISQNNRRSIDSFFREGDCQHIREDAREAFLRDKNFFFESLIDSGRLNVHYTEMSAQELCQAIRFLKDNKPDLGAVFIDYVQLINLLDSGRLSRQEQLKQVCIMLKDCAVETGLPIVIAAQFNRQVTCEADLSPICISEAGDLERIACLLLGFWNRRFIGFSKEKNKNRREEVITTPRDEIYMEILKGRKIGNGHNSVLLFNGNQGLIENSIKSCKSSPLNHSPPTYLRKAPKHNYQNA